MTSLLTLQKIQATNTEIFKQLRERTKQTIRQLAEKCHLPKSNVHRYVQAQKKRNQHPESWFWETSEGQAWLKLQVHATLYMFGLQGVGAGRLSQYFKMIRIDKHVGVSESAILSQLKQMEILLPQFQEACEKSIENQDIKVVIGMDETFFCDFMILVMADLKSGYLFLEDIADDRCFETWYAKTKPRLESLGIKVDYAVSDRAKALIKLAITGLEAESVADVFHAQQDISRSLGTKLGKLLKKLKNP